MEINSKLKIIIIIMPIIMQICVYISIWYYFGTLIGAYRAIDRH